MERIAKPMLTGLLVWLLVLSSGALAGWPLDVRHGSRPDGGQSRHRSGIPAKRATTVQDEEVKLTCPRKVTTLETAVAGPKAPLAITCRHAGLAPLSLRRKPLYLTLCTLIV
jgi:hypothetical protein